MGPAHEELEIQQIPMHEIRKWNLMGPKSDVRNKEAKQGTPDFN